MSPTDPTLDELDAFLRVMYPMTWDVTTSDNQQARRDIYRKAIAAAIGQARRNDAVERKDHPEWKDGYRDGLNAGLNVAQTVADDNGSIEDAAGLIRALAASKVLT